MGLAGLAGSNQEMCGLDKIPTECKLEECAAAYCSTALCLCCIRKARRPQPQPTFASFDAELVLPAAADMIEHWASLTASHPMLREAEGTSRGQWAKQAL